MRNVFFTADAVRQLKKFPKMARALIKKSIRVHLMEGNPAETSRNKFRLRRASEFADFELREGNLCVFYRVEEDRVVVTLLGRKDRNKLVIEDEEFEL